MSFTATYDPVLSRVRLATGVAPTSTATVLMERSTNLSTWTTVRGGTAIPTLAGETARLDDYEFPVGVPITYRAEYFSATGVSINIESATAITVNLDAVWIKSLTRPFLNRAVTVVDFSDVERPARGGTFDVIGRSLPVAITDVRGSRRYTLDVLTETLDESTDFDLAMASGDVILVHTPADSPVPGIYAQIGDVTQTRFGRVGPRRVFSLPLTEVAAPTADVAGASNTWQAVLNSYPIWFNVIDGEGTWFNLTEGIGSPGDVIVP